MKMLTAFPFICGKWHHERDLTNKVTAPNDWLIMIDVYCLTSVEQH